jgi:hypothetical protein
LRYLAANTAHDLVQWDLADSGIAGKMQPRDVDDIAEDARKNVMESLSGLTWQVLRKSAWHDERASQSNGRTYPVAAMEVETKLGGEIEAAWPWLRAMSLRGPGSRLALGISQLSIYLSRP